MKKPKIILASASIGRRTLLKQLGIPFEIMISNVDEDAIKPADPFKILVLRAKAKADSTIKKLNLGEDPAQNSYLIICADSEAVLENKTYGKVKNKAEARTMVKALMGKTHDFSTATDITLLEKGKVCKRWQNLTKTPVTVRKMIDSEINQYVSRYDFTRFAATYTLNETPWDWVTKIDGSYTNVIGLPFEVLLPILRNYKFLE